jgi:hypothetical protein
MVKRFLITSVFLMILLAPFFIAAAGESESTETSMGRAGNGNQPVLNINPREIDLGAIGPGEESKRVYYLKNTGTGDLPWITEGPEGWTQAEPKILTGTAGVIPQPLKIHLIFRNESVQVKPDPVH